MSADIPNLIIPRDNGSTHTDHLHAITTYLDQAIKDNTETIDDFQTRLERVRSHFETTLPQTRLQTDRLSVIAQDLDAVSQVVARLSGGRIKEGEKKKEKANITTTTTLTGTQLTASPAANPASPEQPIITTNSPVTQPPSTSPKLPKPQVPCAPGPRPSPLLPSEIPPAIDEFTGADLRRGLLEMPQNWQNMPTAEPAHNEFPPASAPQEEATGAASLWWPGLGWPSAGWQSGQVEPEAKDKQLAQIPSPHKHSQLTGGPTTIASGLMREQ
ncbi:hypothetical protein C7212DRAFT_367266 [Tuber magnatum]|uniref:Uncharacterized protein n=1 Tax=Tuber magnatum TaxID=42249 RepID=A0A317SBF7_9PEZI|nr:hypothetical protein C7212DRAFT_367266 [Tuber magnatum]